MARGLPYDSDSGRDYAAAITALMSGASYAQSARIAEAMGPFDEFEANREPMLRVMRKHRDAVKKIDAAHVPMDLLQAAKRSWDEVVLLGDEHGLRNSQISVLAPTGTIAFMMDCDTTGVEPDIALVKYKKLVGGGMIKIVNQTVPQALKRLGYDKEEVRAIVEFIDENDTIEGAPYLKEEHLPVFDCAFKPAQGSRSIHYMGHLKMLAAAQPYISGAISKTINMPEDSTSEDIMQAYIEGWQMGLKAVAIYRDNCKRSQPLSTKRDEPVQAVVPLQERRAVRRKLPDERQAITHKFSINEFEGYITVGLYEDGTAGRDLPGDGQARLHHLRPDGLPGHGDLDRPPVRGAAADAGRQVQPHAFRALGLHQAPGDPDRQVDHGLHLPLAGLEVPVAGGQDRGRGRAARGSGGRDAGVSAPPGRRPAGVRGPGRERRDAEAHLPLPAGRPELPRLRLDHGEERQLLQVPELRLHERLQLG